MTHDETLSIRITKAMAKDLRRREELTDVPTARYVRRLITTDLNPFEFDTSKPNAFDDEQAAKLLSKPIEPLEKGNDHDQP